MKIIKNQVEEYCNYIRQDMMKIYNMFADKDTEENRIKFINSINTKIDKIKYYMENTIDIGGIIEYKVKPRDLVKLEYDDGTSLYAFEVKEGRKKAKYYYCGNYIY